MSLTSVSLVLCASLLGVVLGTEDEQRIVGGKNADISEFPYQVSLRLRGRHFCGGSIIGEKHVLTAAHCIKGLVTPPYSDMLVYTGTSLSTGNSGKSYRVKRVDVHEGYLGTESSSYKNDVAVITLAEKIAFNSNTRKIELPSKDVSRGESAIISGWGIRRYPSNAVSVQLQKADMKIVPNTNCMAYVPARLYSGHVCAFQRKGVGACSGDSGGPLAVDGQVVGIASWVVPCGEGYPDVYTKVYAYKDWINAVMARSS